jgi:VWFA-related protein
MALKSRSSGILFFLCSKALVLVLAVSCWSALSAAYAQSDRAFKMRVEVELTTFEVVALDKKGNPVRNLKKEDFQLYEDGKKQEIYGVDEVIAESAVSPLGANPFDESALHRGKTVLLVFDDTSINPQYIQASRDSARRFVSEHMRSQDVFAVAAYGMSLQIYQNFTGNREEVLQAIEICCVLLSRSILPSQKSKDKNLLLYFPSPLFLNLLLCHFLHHCEALVM